jgi:hypothetical protein
MASNDLTIDAFFKLLGSGTTSAGDLNTLTSTVFCQVDDAQNPTMPAVGITGHGPNFIGAGNGPPLVGVTALFSQLITSFPNIKLTELTKKRRLYSGGSSPVTIIGTQATLTGTYQAGWFAKTSDPDSVSHYSKPLSDIPAFAPSIAKSTKVPAFAEFEFGSATPYMVSRLLIYLDRYSFVRDLHQAADPPPASLFSASYHRRR